MADPEDRIQPEGVPPDGRPRRQPPIIEGEAIELAADGSPAAAAGAAPWPAWLFSRKVAAGIAAGLIAVLLGLTTLVYLASSNGSGPSPQSAAGVAPARTADTASNGSGGTAVAATTPARTPPVASGITMVADQTSPPGDPSSPGVSTPPVSAPGPDVKELEARLAAADAALAAMKERVDALDRTVSESADSARAAAERADKAVHEFEDAKKSGDEQDAAQQLDRSAIDDLTGRIKALESRQMTVRQIQERLDRLASAAGSPDKAVRLAVAAAALRNAVERDRPFETELATARAIGLDVGGLAALEPFAATGLPRRSDLLRELSALLPEMRRVAVPPGQDLGYLDRIQASAARMLNIRPVKDVPGDDPPAVLSRIEHKMVHQDVDDVIAELDKLPASAKELAQPWRAKAEARRDAIEAVRTMAAASLTKLGEPLTSGSSSQ